MFKRPRGGQVVRFCANEVDKVSVFVLTRTPQTLAAVEPPGSAAAAAAAAAAMLNVEHGIMPGGRNDNSPDPHRRKRPLSMIEENVDEEVGTGDGPGGTAAAELDRRDGVVAAPAAAKQIVEPTASRAADKKEPEPQRAFPTKKTRKVAITHQRHPDLGLPSPRGGGKAASVEPLGHGGSAASADCRGPLESPNNQTVSGSEGDLTRLKDTAIRLNLKTRRASYLTWRAKYVDKPRDPPEVKVVSGGDERLTQERKARMDNALAWIREELIDLRRQDQSLARQLLGIRHELSSLRLAVSCEEHQELLEEAQDQMEELKELSRFADFPPDMLGSSPLRQIGVTKMNLSSRRFSTC